MSLSKVTYVDGVTVIGAQNLNDIQDAIIAAEQSEADLASAVAQNAADIATNTQAIADVEQEVYKAFPVDNASGAVAFFPDGADGLPVAELTVGIVPVQNLNGYANPWPPGGGKNLLENTGPDTVTGNGVTFTRRSDGGISVSGTATRNAYYRISGGYGSDQVSLPPWLAVGSKYTASGTSAGCKVVVYFYDSDGATITTFTSTFTVPANAVYYGVFVLVEATGTAINATVYPQIERGETATDFSPYSNVCPISGRTGLTLTQTGKNLLPKGSDLQRNGINFAVQSSGEVAVTGTATGNAFWGVEFEIPPGTYTLTGCPQGGGFSSFRLEIRDRIAGNVIQGIIDSGNGSTFSISEPLTAFVNIRIASGYAAPAVGLKISPMLRLASVTDVAFAPCASIAPLSLSWESEAGTVYAGTLEVTSGVLTARPCYAAYAGEALVGPWVSSLDVYAPGAVPTTGAQVVDLGGAETVYRLTAQEVKTLPGANSIWSDAGDTAVTYRADPTKYIDKRLQVVQAQIDTDT